MFNWFRARRDRDDAQQRAFLEALSAITSHFASGQKAQAEALSELAAASAAQAQGFNSYLSLFSTTSPTTSRAFTDQDEFNKELRDQGYPSEGSAEEQLKWVLDHSNEL